MYKKYNYIKHLNFLNNTFQIYSTVFKKKPPTNLLLQCFHDKRQAYVSPYFYSRPLPEFLTILNLEQYRDQYLVLHRTQGTAVLFRR